MAKPTGSKNAKRRIPRLCFTQNRNPGWHVHYRDPQTNVAKRHRVGPIPEKEAKAAFNAWLAAHLGGSTTGAAKTAPTPKARATGHAAVKGSVGRAASGLLQMFKAQVRPEDAARARGTIGHAVYVNRGKYLRDFLAFLNQRHGQGTASRMLVGDLSMADVEASNRSLAIRKNSASQVAKRMQMVKRIIDRAEASRIRRSAFSRLLQNPTSDRRTPLVWVFSSILLTVGRVRVGFGPVTRPAASASSPGSRPRRRVASVG